MFEYIVVVLILIAVIFYFNLPGAVSNYYKALNVSRQIPGLQTHWLWGNVHQMAADFHEWYALSLDLVQKGRYKIVRRWLGPFKLVILVVHPQILKVIVKEPKDESVYRLLRPWLGDGLLVSSGKKWARNRRLLTPGFHYEILQSYVPVYGSCVGVLCDKLKVNASNNEPVKLFDNISMLSLDVILQCAFSYESDCQNLKTGHPYVKAMLTILEMIFDRYMNPLYTIDLYYWNTPTGKQHKIYCDLVHDFSEKVIRERKKALGLDSGLKTRDDALKIAKHHHNHLDFLDILLAAEDEDGEGLTDLEIRDEVDTFMFEGHDTTTSGMCWTLYCLAKHPEHQEKVREEVQSVLMGRDLLEYDDLKELKYTQWCIKESMRLYPPVPEYFRVLSQDTELEGVVVPKGTSIVIGSYNLHRHPDVWDNPNEFDPLRFSPESCEGRDPYAYIPFSAGNRNCIGQTFALNELKVVIASIVKRFKMILDPNHEPYFNRVGILKSKNDIQVYLQTLE